MKTCENEPLLYSITHATIVHTIDPNQVASAPPHTIAKPPHVNVVRSLTPMVQTIFSTTYSKVHGCNLNGDVLPHIQLRTPLFSNLPSVFEEMNQVLDRYYTQWEEANFWFRVIWLAFVVLFVLTGGLGLIFICVVFMYRAHVHSNFREKFKTEVKPALQLMCERENEKLRPCGFELMGSFQKVPIVVGRRRVLRPVYLVELFSSSHVHNPRVIAFNGNGDDSSLSAQYYQQQHLFNN